MWCRSARGLRKAAGLVLTLCLLPAASHAVLGEPVVALGRAPAITSKPVAAPLSGAAGGAGGAGGAGAVGPVGAVGAAPAAGVHVHTHQGADGAQVREYTGADGLVFAVAWSTRSKPRLDLLLGRYFESYAAAARTEQNLHRRPRHAARTEQGDLMVQAQGHAQAFTGRAVLRSRLPAGFTLDDVR
jgi:hypothetical protein